MSIKLVSVNIEYDKHLPTVKEFLAREKADVVCLMEVLEENLGELAAGYPARIFAPNVLIEGKKMGVAIIAKSPFVQAESFYCDGREVSYLPINQENVGVLRPLVNIVTLKFGGRTFQIGATHFTWTKVGMATDKQRADVKRLLEKLAGKELVLCGDFNIPREENEMYKVLAAKYKDNIPPEVKTTLDPQLHRVNKKEPGKLAFVVDYLWTTPSYEVENVRVECGVSDHCAVVADIV